MGITLSDAPRLGHSLLNYLSYAWCCSMPYWNLLALSNCLPQPVVSEFAERSSCSASDAGFIPQPTATLGGWLQQNFTREGDCSFALEEHAAEIKRNGFRQLLPTIQEDFVIVRNCLR